MVIQDSSGSDETIQRMIGQGRATPNDLRSDRHEGVMKLHEWIIMRHSTG